MAIETVPFTREGYERLKQELETLKTIERPKIIREIADARAHGDLSENAEYDAAKDAQGLLELKISEMETVMSNARIIDATVKKLGLPAERVVLTVSEHANTSAASVPLALDVAVRDGRINAGDVVVLEAMGGGFTWGASVVRM